MSLIIKDKIGNTIPGTPTMSDKYDIMSAPVGNKPVVAGQIVALDNVFKGGALADISATTGIHGVVAHQNVKAEFNKPFGSEQVFMPGETVGVIIKGFTLALAKEDINLDNLKTELQVDLTTGLLTSSGQNLIDIRPTGYKTLWKDAASSGDKRWLVEVEVKGR